MRVYVYSRPKFNPGSRVPREKFFQRQKNMLFARSAFSLLRTVAIGPSLRNGPQVESVRQAGHSHWQNIRHIKAAKDLNKARMTERHVRFIEAAIAMGGGSDPRLNKHLANAIEAAKKTQVVTNAAIEAALKRAKEGPSRKNQRTVIYEFIGDHGVLLIAKCEVSNASKFVHTLKLLTRKHKWSLSKGGVKERFNEKGFVCVTGKEDGGKFDPDEALLVAIEGGAEEMLEMGEGETLTYEFLSSPNNYLGLMGALQKNGYMVNDVGTKWIPMMPVELTEDQLIKVGEFCDELEDLPEVVGAFTNIA
ncbi:transcriptional regulator-like [Tropilaelaps mercedesae]|uniref:Transcriptional regulator-like n=1 Tax=Tropilaelaps mercedesae TaxID=418985 RepID=A0A1V9XJ98_9ACAR|nr:transcriptional regulator-like [Tropilaelaps mercedesae]